MLFRFGFSIECYAKIQYLTSIGDMKLFYDHLKISVFGKNISLSLINKNLEETFFPDILICMENTNASYGRLPSLDP